MMPYREYGDDQMFQLDRGRLQFLLMLDDLYFSKYGTKMNRKEMICEKLKQAGYQVIIGLDYSEDQYYLWTPYGDRISEYLCQYPEESQKSRDEISEILEWEDIHTKQPDPWQNTGFGSYVADSLGLEFLSEAESFDPFGNESITQQKMERSERKKALKTVYADLKELSDVLSAALKEWMNAEEPFVFVVNANEWQQILEKDSRENKGKLQTYYENLLKRHQSNGLFLQVISPISGWHAIYNKAIELPKKWNVNTPEKCEEPVPVRITSLTQWAKKQNQVNYIPSLTVEAVEKMIYYQYLHRNVYRRT